MSGIGDAVRDEAAYKAQPAADREYWEKGDNGSLTQGQKDKLADEADEASKYDKATKSSKGDVPAKGGKTDHGAVVRNVKEYVAAKLSPKRDLGDPPAPPRPLGKMIDESGTPEDPKPPSDNPDNDVRRPAWVCINRATYLAALMRVLGYPVREVNVKLTTGGLKYLLAKVVKTYQEAAVQVWFDGKWHYVDPYTCFYDPKLTLDVYSEYNDFHTYGWVKHTPPGATDWAPPKSSPLNDPARSGWRELDDDEVGPDLQKRFHSQAASRWLSHPTERLGRFATFLELDPGDTTLALAEGARSGVVIGTDTPGVELGLVDEHGQITDRERDEIPGAFHLAAGTPVAYVKSWPLDDEGRPIMKRGHFDPRYHEETVFAGTCSVVARWDELRTHRLTLIVRGNADEARLGWRLSPGEYPVTLHQLPDAVRLDDGAARVPFTLTIEPVDFCCHLALADLLDRGRLTPEEIEPLHEAQLAARGRRRRWDRQRARPEPS